MISDYKEIAAREIESKKKKGLSNSPNANGETDSTPPSSSPSNSARKNSSNDELVNGSKNKKIKSEKGLDYANTQAFRSIQDTIERDIHRTYPVSSFDFGSFVCGPYFCFIVDAREYIRSSFLSF